MSLVAVALALSAAPAQVEALSLAAVDSRLAVRVAVSGSPGLVRVHRDGDRARVSIGDAALATGLRSGRVAWAHAGDVDPALVAATPARLDRLEISANASEVRVLVDVPPEVSVEVRRDGNSLLLGFRQAPEAGTMAWNGEPPPPRPPEPAAPRAEPDQTTGKPEERKEEDTAELARRLFPLAEEPADPGARDESVAALYPLLFPAGVPEAQRDEQADSTESVEPALDAGLPVGPFRLRAALDARYVNADTFAEDLAVPTRDEYLEVQPRLAAAAPIGEGSFTLEYLPAFRAFATYDTVNTSSHQLSAGIDLPVGASIALRARDRFRSGVLDARVVDPGGEYFFGLGHFRRNDVDVGARAMLGPRLSVELAGAVGAVRFQEDSSFFDYDTRLASAGLGFELTPNLKAVAAYVYDAVPRPPDRPEAEATAHSAQLSLSGDILPLLSGDLAVGYRRQESPNAGPGGTRYSGLSMSAALTREIGRESSLALYASRTTPVSAFEENAFYVSTAVQAVLQVPLPARVQLRGGAGYQRNDYRVVSAEIGRPREDEIVGWYVGLRRPVVRNLYLGVSYRREDRRSNIDAYDTDAEGFYVQLEWDLFGAPGR